ncbi:conserved hypothetical protein [Shewanella denitrificans OS217]|jgi:hypothetical protein|uniref:Uncharacterized protein n=1 Tax=Shewanella denitrificans (strain OS217 / ATCC BAA-1090 / DSM 15013) TaxID=318161 RepID=Q12SD8_SHEDO|nr:hypothetical protein [Shewanella denitrificans]ABE53638.1 conserved hypothetical protein [Shewanella denitrificans OS217]
MGLDSIYAMLARPVQALYNRKRNVNKVSLTDDIHPDSHESPQSQLPPSTAKNQEARIKPNLVKAKEKTASSINPDKEMASDMAVDDGAIANSKEAEADIVLPNGEHIKHIDIEV